MTKGLVPDVQDLVAAGIITVTYLLRIAATDAEFSPPWFIYLTTDLLLPSMAGAWLFVATMFILIRRVERISHGPPAE